MYVRSGAVGGFNFRSPDDAVDGIKADDGIGKLACVDATETGVENDETLFDALKNGSDTFSTSAAIAISYVMEIRVKALAWEANIARSGFGNERGNGMLVRLVGWKSFCAMSV